jgi:hypothetical protein
MNNADYTLSNYNGTSDEARNAVVIITGNQNASYSVICPAQQKLYIITNSLNASAIAYFKPVGGSSIAIANGSTVSVYCTGSTMVAVGASTFSTANFGIFQSGSKLYFTYNGSNIASLDSSGNFITTGSETAGGTP